MVVLNLAGAYIGDDGCRVLSEALQHAAALETLDLSSNNLRADGGVALAKLISTGRIKHLKLQQNYVGMFDYGIRAIADALPASQGLETVDLSSNHMGPHGFVAVANALGQMHRGARLWNIELSWNMASRMGGEAILRSVRQAQQNNGHLVKNIELKGCQVQQSVIDSISTCEGNDWHGCSFCAASCCLL